MLRLIFPPKVVERLVFNAVTSQPDDDSSHFAELLSAAAAGDPSIADIPDASNLTAHSTFGGGSTATAITPPSLQRRRFSEDTGPAEADLTPASLNNKNTPGHSSLQTDHHHLRHHSQTENGAPTTSTTPTARPAFRSPFAAFIGTPIRTSSDSEGAGATGSGDSRSISLPLSYSGNAAAALLRQASSIPFVSVGTTDGDDECMSPTYSEIEGYEDLVSEDTAMSASRRPSFCMDRAVSKDSSTAAAADAAVTAQEHAHVDYSTSTPTPTPGKRESVDAMAVDDGATPAAALEGEEDPHRHRHHFEQQHHKIKEDATDLAAGFEALHVQDTGSQIARQGHHEEGRHISPLSTITEGPSQTDLRAPSASPSSSFSSLKTKSNPPTTRIESTHHRKKDSAPAVQDDHRHRRTRVRASFFNTLFHHTPSSDFIALVVIAIALLLMGMLGVYLWF